MASNQNTLITGLSVCLSVCLSVWCASCVCACVRVRVCVCVRARLLHCRWHFFWKTKIKRVWYIYSSGRDIRSIRSKTLPLLPTLYPSVFNFPYSMPNPTPFSFSNFRPFRNFTRWYPVNTSLFLKKYICMCVCVYIYIHIYVYVNMYIPLILKLFGSIINYEKHPVNFLDARWC
jgi:hypothetical protein